MRDSKTRKGKMHYGHSAQDNNQLLESKRKVKATLDVAKNRSAQTSHARRNSIVEDEDE